MLKLLIRFLKWLVGRSDPTPEAPVVYGYKRSGSWRTVRKKYLLTEPICAVCTTDEDLDVHHIVPVHVNNTLELDPENLITLCTRCHLLIGHLDDWKSWNANVRQDASYLRFKIQNRPKHLATRHVAL